MNNKTPRAQAHAPRKIRKSAFTLAEVLITLAIIGVVAALIIVPFSMKASERALDTAKDIIEKDLVNTLNRMRLNDDLSGYETTQQFVNTLKKYTKIWAVCPGGEIKKCFGYDALKLSNNEDFDVKFLNQQYMWALINDPGPGVAVRLAKGVTGVISYQRFCPWVPPIGVDKARTTQCLAMVYDVNGSRRPNRVGKDIFLLNAYLYPFDAEPWEKGKQYYVGDLILEKGLIFKCLGAHKSGSRSNTRNPSVKSNRGNWEVVGTVDGEIPQYVSTPRFAVGFRVQHNGNVYARTDYHLTSGQTPYSNKSSAYWIYLGKLGEVGS